MNKSSALEHQSAARHDPSRDPHTGRFLTGNNGSGGRRRGSRNRLAEAFVADVYEEYCQHGKDALRRVREDNPFAFLSMVVRLLPQKYEVEATSPLEGMTTDELRAFAADLKRWREECEALNARTTHGSARTVCDGSGGGGGSGEAGSSATPPALPPLPSKEEVALAWAAGADEAGGLYRTPAGIP